jgi:DNA-binding transcriptional regulator of glucitol operon
MSPLVAFGLLFLSAYLIQSFFSFKQIQSFNKKFQDFRKRGQVVVGKKSGRFIAGTVLLFLVDTDGIIQDGTIMQGISVFARFKKFKQFNGIGMMDLHPKHPLLQKEMKFTRLAIENGRELYIRFKTGSMEAETYSNITPFGINLAIVKAKFKRKVIPLNKLEE